MTKKEFFARAATALACAWVVWQTLSYYEHTQIAGMVSVFVGRYGDELIILGWKALKDTINRFNP